MGRPIKDNSRVGVGWGVLPTGVRPERRTRNLCRSNQGYYPRGQRHKHPPTPTITVVRGAYFVQVHCRFSPSPMTMIKGSISISLSISHSPPPNRFQQEETTPPPTIIPLQKGGWGWMYPPTLSPTSPNSSLRAIPPYTPSTTPTIPSRPTDGALWGRLFDSHLMSKSILVPLLMPLAMVLI